MGTTKIEWADRVWNPVTGCTKVSQGCARCYAERIANRFWGERKFTDVICHEDRLNIPLRWKKPRRVFVNSMSDLFHKDVPDEFIYRVFRAMSKAPQHTFMILTKRPGRMPYLVSKIRNMLPDRLNHVWLGVSVENQQAADVRIPLLLKTPAAVRFLSCEPLLGLVDLSSYLICQWEQDTKHPVPWNKGDIVDREKYPHQGYPAVLRAPLDWVIAGGESGPDAWPMRPDWARSLRDQCTAEGVPFFLKQMTVDGKMVKMPELDGKVWKEFPNA